MGFISAPPAPACAQLADTAGRLGRFELATEPMMAAEDFSFYAGVCAGPDATLPLSRVAWSSARTLGRHIFAVMLHHLENSQRGFITVHDRAD